MSGSRSSTITTSEARRDLFGIIERVNLDHTENARRLLNAVVSARDGEVTEHDLIGP